MSSSNWTEQEIERAVLMYIAGHDYRFIAERLGRTVCAVRAKFDKDKLREVAAQKMMEKNP